MPEEHTNNVGVTHVWPYSKLVNPEAQPLSDEREADVWDELRELTFDEDVRGQICVALHATINHDAFANDFAEDLEKDDVVNNRVAFYQPREVEFHIHRHATKAYSFKRLRSVAEAYKHGPNGFEEVPDTSTPIVVPAEPARDETEKRIIPFHLGSKLDAEVVIKQHRNQEMCALVLWHPDETQLKYLSMVRSRCPELPVYIFHYEYRGDKFGVEREAGAVSDVRQLFETQSTFEKEVEMQWVIERIAYEGESTWFAALPKQMKTWVMLCVVKALLTGWSLFGDERFKVPNKSKKLIYLIPEAGRSSVKKRLKLLGLMEFLYDPITNPEGRLFVRTLSAGEKIKLTDPALLEFAKDADIFIDTAVRYLEGDENSVKDVKVLTENVLNLLSVGARSLWVAHHAAKGFENATTMTLQNMFRGSGEFGAALTNAYGMCQTEEKTSTLHFHPIVGRDLDELIPDMILQGRPYLSTIANFAVLNANAEKFSGVKPAGRPEDPQKAQLTLDVVRMRTEEKKTFKEIADAVGKPESTVRRYYNESKEFDVGLQK